MNIEEKTKKQSAKEIFYSLWDLISPSHRRIVFLLLIILLCELGTFVSPYILKLIIDKITNFSATEIIGLVWLVLAYFGMEQITSFMNYFRDIRNSYLLVDVEYYLPLRAQKKLMSLSLGYHERENTGNKIIKIERGVSKILMLLENTLSEMVPTILQLLISGIMLAIIDWRLAISMLFFVPIFIFITYRSNVLLYPIRKTRYRQNEEASGKMGQAIMNINAVQSFVQERREIRELDKLKTDIKNHEVAEWRRLLGFSLGKNVVVDFGRVVILGLGVYFLAQGEISVGSLVFVVTLSEKAYFSLYRITRFYDRVAEGIVGVHRFMNLINQKELINNPKKGFHPSTLDGKVEFKNVSFSYDENRQNALDGANFEISAGGVTALIGPSGSGKTTIARLVYRHYDPTAGEILVDGRNLKDYDIHDYRRLVAIVPQEVEIFDISIRDNIAYARPDASFKEIQAAARIANAEEFILRLEAGYNTLTGERGTKLSGGQRQRLGIARAILANPRILIFDEATSSLDSYSESLIQDAMNKISRDRTMIIIAHRLSTIRRADKIIVLEKGCVKEEGIHAELARKNGGLYAQLLSLQAAGDVIDS